MAGMKPIANVLRILVTVLIALASTARADESWQPLFNGRDLTGWTAVNGAADTWFVRDGRLVTSGKPTGFLRTDAMFDDFDLELEWRLTDAGGNSGVFVFADGLPQIGAPYPEAIELQILDGDQGSIFGIRGATIEPLTRPDKKGNAPRARAEEDRQRPVGQWNQYALSARGGLLELAVNGKVVTRARSPERLKGYLALQAEGHKVEFRNLRIRPLTPASQPARAYVARSADGFRNLMDGVSLAGWFEGDRSGHESQTPGRWSMRDGVVSLVPQHKSRGNLWIKAEYGNLVLIADWRLPSKPVDRPLPVFTPDGMYTLDAAGKPLRRPIPDAGDSGIYLRGNDRSQVNIWCQPVGSGDINDYHKDAKLSEAMRKACMPSEHADAPLGQWNRFIITVEGDRVSVELNGHPVIHAAQLPGMPDRGRIALQDHGDAVEFRNLLLKPLD